MTVKPIKTEEEYDYAISRIDQLFNAPKGSIEAKELNLLVLSVNKYEAENYPIDEPDPIEYIKIRMEEMAVKQLPIHLLHFLPNNNRMNRLLISIFNFQRIIITDLLHNCQPQSY